MNSSIFFYCSSTSLGGLELNVARLALWLKEEGIDIHFGGTENSPLINRIENSGIPCKAFRKNRSYYDFGAAKAVWQSMQQTGSLVLFVHDTRDISLAATVKMMSGYRIKTMYQQQMQIGVNKRDLLHTFRYRHLDAWITPLEWLKSQIGLRTRFDIAKVHIAPLGVDPKSIQVSETRSDCRSYFNLPEDAFVLGILGRIDDGKGQDFLIEVVKELKERGHEIHLLMVGEPTLNKNDGYPEKLARMTDEYGLKANVHMFPFMERTGIFFKAIDAFAMASVGETYGMVTVEAMISGVPVIGTNTGGTTELLEQGRSGLLFTPGNLNEFALALEKLTTDQHFTNGLAERARQRALSLYTRDVQVQAVAKVISSLTNAYSIANRTR